MDVSVDIILKGECWKRVVKEYSAFFKEQPYFDIFILCTSIGIILDKRWSFDDKTDEKITVPRNVIVNHDKGKLDYFLKTAILTTNTELKEYEDEKERVKIAFADDETVEFNKIKFLVEFANYGALELEKNIGETELETMINFNKYLNELRTTEIATLRTDRLDEDVDMDFFA